MLVSRFTPFSTATQIKKLNYKSRLFSHLALISCLSTLLINTSATAQNQCSDIDATHINAEHLRATYTVTDATGQQTKLTLIRNDQRVIYQPNPISFEMWNKRGEYVRYFPMEQRSISYRKGDLLSLNMHFNFQQLNHLVNPSTLQQLTIQQASNQPQITDQLIQNCQTSQYYQGVLQGNKIALAWQAQLALPLAMTIEKNNRAVEYQLSTLQTFDDKQFAALISGYKDMDFADVGDNESDPFIAKMIHQGFIQHGSSGFYDSQGNQLSGSDGSHQH